MALAAIVLPALAMACTLLVDTEGLSGSAEGDGGPANGEGGPPPSDATTDRAAATDAAPGDAAQDAGARCVADAGSPLVPIADVDYCIDRAEVSVGDYNAFLVARGGSTAGQRADCAGNASFLPLSGAPDLTQPNLPVRYVDFCDAVAYCDWAGKRLCGAADGSKKALDAGADPGVSQWFHACSHANDGLHAYPYGPLFDQTRCNSYLVDGGVRNLHDVGTTAGCEGGYPGIFDMAGNVDEWEDLCEVGDAGLVCFHRGGSYNNGYAGGSACATLVASDPTSQASTTGFRCCSR